MRHHMLTPALSMLLMVVGTVISGAQSDGQHADEGCYGTASPCVTATIGKDHIRFASLGTGHRMRLEIVNQAGDRVFDSDFHDGNLVDWQMEDSHGIRLPDDVYGCLVTVEDMTGRLTHRSGLVRVTRDMPRFETLQSCNAGMGSSSEGQDTVTILRDDEELPMVQLLHDGESGRIVSGKGGLSFRVGNALAGKDVESTIYDRDVHPLTAVGRVTAAAKIL